MSTRLRRRNKRKKFITIACASIIVAVIAVSGYMLYQNTTLEAVAGTENGQTLPAVEEKKINAFVATSRMEAGKIPELNCFDVIEISAADSYAVREVITDSSMLSGMRLKKDIEPYEILTKSHLISISDWFEDDDRLVEHSFVEGVIPATLSGSIVGRYVDILLYRQEKEDEIVVSKAIVIANAGSKIMLKLKPEERERLKQAATEGSFYFAVYVDGSQPAVAVTYMPEYMPGGLGDQFAQQTTGPALGESYDEEETVLEQKNNGGE